MQTKIIVAICFAGAVGTSSQAAELRSPDTPSPPQVAELLSPDTLSETERVGSVEAEMKGALVLRGQVLLDRAHFSSGEIDAAYGQNLRMAIQGYQKSQGLTVTGNIDAATAFLSTGVMRSKWPKSPPLWHFPKPSNAEK